MRSEGVRASRASADFDDEGEVERRPGLLQRLGWSPRDAVGFVVAVFASGAILINIMFMQPGPREAPKFKRVPLQSAAAETRSASVPVVPRARPVESAPARNEAGAPARVQPKSAKTTASVSSHRLSAAPLRQDPIAELIAPTKRVLAVQRALSDFGYGQIKPTGILDAETQAAIEKFERTRKLPVTGQASERVARELASVVGHPIE